MNSPADDVAQYLTDQLFTWPVYVGTEPDAPSDCLTVYDTGGTTKQAELRRPTVQLRARATSYPTAYAMIDDALARLTEPNSRAQNGAVYVGIFAVSDILAIGRDDNDRHLFTVNLQVMRG